MTHVSLFTGIGGLDLAAEAAGFETVLQVERDPYCQRVLKQWWPDVPRLDDVRNVRPTDESVIVVSGGFPCQPFSQAGKRGGESDNRFLWPEMLAAVGRLNPLWVVAENVPGILSIDEGAIIQRVYCDLERAGFETLPPLVYPAAAVGAPHLRNRVFIVARRPTTDADSSGREQQRWTITSVEEYTAAQFGGWWSSEPDVGRVAYGVPARVDRLRALGNAVVPQQAYPIFKTIADMEAGQ